MFQLGGLEVLLKVTTMKHENIKTTRIIDEATLSYLQILEVRKEKKWEKNSVYFKLFQVITTQDNGSKKKDLDSPRKLESD